MDKRQFYINGKWVSPRESRDFGVVNPATQETIATISLGSAADVERAVSAAKVAFDSWSQSSIPDRIALLERIITVYDRRAEELSGAITREMGAPITFSRAAQTPSGAGHLRSTLDALQAHAFERPSQRGGSLLRDEAVGICGLITPWNWPMNQVVVKVAPAIAAGCTVILKPSELSPLSALVFAEILDEAGCPPGVFNLVNGDGAGVGAPLAAHPDIAMVSFTGSTRAGVSVSKAAADTVKRVSLELGGKSPNLLFADAKLDEAVRWSVLGCFRNSGQSCNAPTRLLVEQSVCRQVVDLAATIADTVQVGDPAQEGNHIGPIVSGTHLARVQHLIKVGIDEGARLIAGGLGCPQGMDKGYFARPTIFADVRNDMTIARDEIFGPVLSIIPFADEDEAVRIANDTPYGLAAFIQSADPARVQRVSRKLRAGSVLANGASADYDVPFGGYKQSGNGRENGVLGLHEFLEVKAITA